VFQQRNGRVDRYGQTQEPHIYYLITECDNDTIRGDTRILEILQQKDEQAYRNIGDPATFMKVHDAEQEEHHTEQAMADGLSAEAFDKLLHADESNDGDELLAMFFNGAQPTTTGRELPLAQSYSIYQGDYDFVKACFEYLNRDRANLVADVSYPEKSQTICVV